VFDPTTLALLEALRVVAYIEGACARCPGGFESSRCGLWFSPSGARFLRRDNCQFDIAPRM